jgi:ribosome-binding protein aMBF1 (putative translation factor)
MHSTSLIVRVYSKDSGEFWLEGEFHLQLCHKEHTVVALVIGDRLRQLREDKKFSQGDVEKRTGLLRCYVSRVENGHTVPAVETLEKFARALEVPMYVLFYDGDEPNSR